MNVKIKWIVLSFAILFSIRSFSQTADKTAEIVLNTINQPLRTVLDNISAQSGFNFIYSDNLVDKIKIDCRINDENVENVLDKVFNHLDISYKIFNEKSIVLFRQIKPNKELYKTVILDKNEAAVDSLPLVVKPTMINRNTLEYPPEAVLGKIEGKTTVKFLITGAGDVMQAMIESSSGYEVLDNASIKYARELKFIPAEANGRTQSIWMTMEFKYYITKN